MADATSDGVGPRRPQPADAPAVALRPGWREQPHPTRLDPTRPDVERLLGAHRDAQDRGDPGYLDPTTGLLVLTATYLRDRGWCCDRGCRHCPYVGAGDRQR